MGLNTKKWVELEEKRAEEWALGLEIRLEKWGNVCFPPAVHFSLQYREFGTP